MDMAMAPPIELDQKTLYFPPPLNRSIENILTVKSSADRPITFKMKTSAPNYYAVKKRTGFIAPRGSEKISITFRQPPAEGGDQYTAAQRQKDKFQLEVRYLADDGSEELAFKAIGTSSQPGDGSQLRDAINALNRSMRIPATGGAPTTMGIPETAKEADVLAAIWKTKSFPPAKDGMKVISCDFKDRLPEHVHVKAKTPQTQTSQAPATETQAMQSAISRVPAAAPAATGEVESLKKQIAQMKAENLGLQQKAKGGGVPLQMAIIAAVVAFVLGAVSTFFS